jgi:hypothetical protein
MSNLEAAVAQRKVGNDLVNPVAKHVSRVGRPIGPPDASGVLDFVRT